jgi:transcriptional regulator with XRE-family HTH domain
VIHLRTERERQRLSLDEAAARARIPVRYVAALERGDDGVLPPGPFRRGYQRQYLESLGFDPDLVVVQLPAAELTEPGSEVDETATLTMSLDEMPLWRLMLAGFLLTMAVVLSLRVASEVIGPVDPEPELTAAAQQEAEQAPAALPTARLRVRAIEPTRLVTRVDGIDSFSGVLGANKVIDLEGREEIVVWAADLTTILITYNGERIEPLGNLSQSRRLVFIQE